MRCSNCTWPNRASATHCVKCGAPLTPETESTSRTVREPTAPMTEQPTETPDVNNSNYNASTVNADVRGTIKVNSDKFPSSLSTDSPNTNPTEKPCPKCGYPTRSNTPKCPHCGFEMARKTPSSSTVGDVNDYPATSPLRNTVEGPSAKHDRPATRMVNDGENRGKFGGTVNPFMMEYHQEPHCSLEPIQRTGERKKPEEVELEGTTIKLNRDNTDRGNLTITSRCQAELTCNDGTWSIVNRSDYPSTFVLASENTPVKDGDIILLGNRMFRFHC